MNGIAEELTRMNAAGVDVMVEESAGMNVSGVDSAVEEEAADVNVMATELAGTNVAGVDEDEQVRNVELGTLLWASDSLYPSAHPKRGSEADVVVVGECTWVAY